MHINGVVVRQWSDPWAPDRAPDLCYQCRVAASWLVWTDETNDDGEGADMHGFPSCHTHLSEVITAKLYERPVIAAQPGTRCGWSNGACRSAWQGDPTTPEYHAVPGPAVHVLCVNLPVGRAGTALCVFHSPFDRMRFAALEIPE